MNDILDDIENLETAITLIQEGASDEKRAGMSMLQKMLDAKKEELQLFEDTMAPLIPEIKSDVDIDQNKFDQVEFRKAV